MKSTSGVYRYNYNETGGFLARAILAADSLDEIAGTS